MSGALGLATQRLASGFDAAASGAVLRPASPTQRATRLRRLRLNAFTTVPHLPAPPALPRSYVHLGSLAYLGMNRAVMQLPTQLPVTSLKGWLAAHVWRALELYMQVRGGGSSLLCLARPRWLGGPVQTICSSIPPKALLQGQRF